MGLGWLVVCSALGGTDPAALKADLEKWDGLLEKHGKYPMHWTQQEIEQLAKGQVVKRRSKQDSADRVMGAAWADVSLAEMWTAVQDEWHWGHVEGLVEERLPGSTFEKKILFQKLDAPWPFKDRQWVILVQNSLDLWEASEHKVIERTWDLSPERGAENESDDGVWVDLNNGGWLAAPAGGGVVVAYHVRAVVGGSIPDDAASTWTMMTLGGMMRGLVESSEASKTHYVAEHPAIRWPDGESIPHFR